MLKLIRYAASLAPSPTPRNGPPDVMMLPSSAHADMTTLPKVDTNCTAPSLIPTVNGNMVRSFSTHGHQSAAKGSSATVSRSDIRLIQLFDFSARGLVRRWRLIGYFPILYNPSQWDIMFLGPSRAWSRSGTAAGICAAGSSDGKSCESGRLRTVGMRSGDGPRGRFADVCRFSSPGLKARSASATWVWSPHMREKWEELLKSDTIFVTALFASTEALHMIAMVDTAPHGAAKSEVRAASAPREWGRCA
jgi:hypothetical protein